MKIRSLFFGHIRKGARAKDYETAITRSAENSSGEIDFLAQRNAPIYAIEVKAEENLRSRSQRAFKERYGDVRAIRFSLSPYREQDWMCNVPPYAMSNLNLWK